MIESLRLADFKNFADEKLRVGPFTVIVGANASGKSNIRDAFRFLHGIGRGYTLAEICGGKYGADWKPIRGSASGIGRFGTHGSDRERGQFALETEMQLPFFDGSISPTIARYRIQVHPDPSGVGGLSVASESLRIGSEEIFSESFFDDPQWKFSRKQPALTQALIWAKHLKTAHKISRVRDEFLGSRFFDFVPNRMREPSPAGRAVMGDGGEYLPTALQEICANPERKLVLIDWVRELTPMDVEDFEFSPDASDKIHLVIRERNGRGIHADKASDGTLRFLAMLAALLGKESDGLYFFEEMENGLHPSRLHLLIELVERETAKGRVQVIATTHSPGLLSLVNDETFGNASVTCRLEDTDDAIIRPIDSLPDAGKLRESQGLDRLLASGWIEDAIAFTEKTDDGSTG